MPPTLVMLHGSNGTGAELSPLSDAMRAYAAVETPTLIGHGGRPLPERLSIQDMAIDLIAFLDERKIARAYVFGYSLGAYLALYLARHFSQRVCGVCTLAGKYVFDETTVRHWTYLADPERVRRLNPQRPGELAKMHHPQDWEAIIHLNRKLFEDIGANPPLSDEDLRAIAMPALIISSDQDQVVPLPETRDLGQLIQGSQVKLFRGQAHPLTVCPIQAIAELIGEWLRKVEAERVEVKK